jgi:hypothetical protein
MTDFSFLYDEDASRSDVITGYQELIDTGEAWYLEGHVGRTAMDLIERGVCMLGPVSHKDHWGNVVPSRHDVRPGTVGSAEFIKDARSVPSTPSEATAPQASG